MVNIYSDLLKKEEKAQKRKELEAKHKKLRKKSSERGKLTIIDIVWFVLIVGTMTGLPILLSRWFLNE